MVGFGDHIQHVGPSAFLDQLARRAARAFLPSAADTRRPSGVHTGAKRIISMLKMPERLFAYMIL